MNMDNGALKRRIAELEAENASLETDLHAAREALAEADATIARLTADRDFGDRAMLEVAEDLERRIAELGQ